MDQNTIQERKDYKQTERTENVIAHISATQDDNF